ncbi:hypothetical protein [Streptomyces olivaceoviridis]
MDDAWLGSVDLTKAKTSVLFRMPERPWARAPNQAAPFTGLSTATTA